MPINETIKKLRLDKGLTQQAFADKLSYNRQKIADWERGKSTPSAYDLILLSKTFNVSADYLLGLSDAATSNKDLQFVCDYTGLSETTIEKLREFHDISVLKDFKADSKHAWIGETVFLDELYGIINAFIENGFFSELIAVIYDYQHAMEITTEIRETIVEDMKRAIKSYTEGIKEDIPVYYDAWELHEIADNCNEIKLHYYELQEIPKAFVREHCKSIKEEFDRVEKEYMTAQRELERLNIEADQKQEGDQGGKDQKEK